MNTQQILQGVKNYIDTQDAGLIYDISKAHASNGVLAQYADLAAALGSGGANIPQEYRQPGMMVRFVQSTDHKYVQYRYMGTSTANADFMNVDNWQGVDEEPVVESHNLVESGGVFKNLQPLLKILGTNLITQELTAGLYNKLLEEGSSSSFKRCLIEDVSSYSYIILNTSVRVAAYVSLTDNSNNILWQSNSINGIEYLNVSLYPGAKKLYFCCEMTLIPDPFIIGLSNEIIKEVIELKDQTDENGIELLNNGLLDGFYNLTPEYISNVNWKCCKIDISSYKLLKIKAAVRAGAYLSLTDASNNILWQSNDSTTTDFVLNLDNYYNGSKYLYYSNENASQVTPSIMAYKDGVALDMNNVLKVGIKELATTFTDGFYKKNLEFSSNVNWKCCIIDISNYGVIHINAAVRVAAYISITDSSNNILWQTNNSLERDFVINLYDYNTPKYLYLSNETGVLQTPSVKGIEKTEFLYNLLSPRWNVKQVFSESDLIDSINSNYSKIILNNDITLNNSLNIARPVVIEGNNHSITFSGTYYLTINSYVTFENVNVVGNQNIENLVNITVGSEFHAQNCSFKYAHATILFVDGICILNKCEVSHSDTNDGAGVVRIGKLYAYNCVFHDNYDEGVSSHAQSYAELVNCEFYNNGYVIGTKTKGATSSYGGCHLGGGLMGKIIGCYSHDNCTFGIGLINFQDLTLTDKEVCYNNVVENNGEAGILCMNCRDITLVNNSVINNTGKAIVFGKPNPAPDIELVESAGYVAGNIMFENTTNSVIVEDISMPNLHIQS